MNLKTICIISLLFVVSSARVFAQVSFISKMDAYKCFGLNESGGEFAAVYPGIDGTHYGYPNKEDLSYVRSKGFSIVRLPFRWERVLRPLTSTTLKNSEINKIKMVLSYAEELGIGVILDMHNFGRYCTYSNGSNSKENKYAIIGEGDCTLERYCNVWKLLAQEFKGYSCVCGYEIMNEPYSMLTSLPWSEIAQAAINAIREVDTETPIVIDGYQYASARNWLYYSDDLRNLKDISNKLVYTAHCYFDTGSSGQYTASYDACGASPTTGIARLKPFVEWCKKYDKQGFVGEYGIPDNDSRWQIVLDNALSYLSDNGVGGTYWSAGHRWGAYSLSVQPENNYTSDRPQMTVLAKYLKVATGIATQENDYHNGHDENIYNLQGMKVTNMQHGIFIYKGKKVIKY